MRRVALIMAGGKGTRLWPLSTEERPKQFVSLSNDGKTLIQKTFERVFKLVDREDIFVCTAERYLELVQKQLGISNDHIILEPMGHNTAPAIILSSLYIRNHYKGDVVMEVFPSDHYVEHEDLFCNDLSKAAVVAENGHLVTIGIVPDKPETGFGYIKAIEDIDDNVKKVDCFVEKPDFDTAKSYYESGKYYWNAGMFVWKVSSLIEELEKHNPYLLKSVEECIRDDSSIDKEKYASVESISIDYALMEKSKNIYMVPSTFFWSDVGSFDAIYNLFYEEKNNNTVLGEVLCKKLENRLVKKNQNNNLRIESVSDGIIVGQNNF